MKQLEPGKSFWDDLLSERESKRQTPSPKDIAANARQFGALLKRAALPFVGVNALLMGCLLDPEVIEPNGYHVIVALLAIATWAVLARVRAPRGASLDFGAIAILTLLICLTQLQLWAAIGAGTVISAALLLAVLRYQAMTQWTLVLYAVYLPWVTLTVLDMPVRLEFALGTLIPVAAFCMACKARIAGGAALAAAAAAGLIEVNRLQGPDATVMLLLGICVALAVWYDWRQSAAEQSSLRQFVGESLTVVLTWAALAAFWGTSQSTWWLWAGVMAAYESAQLWRERGQRPTRLGWIAVILTACLTLELPSTFDWSISAYGVVLIALALHSTGLMREYRFLSNLGLVLTSGTAVIVYFASRLEMTRSTLTTAMLVYGALTIFSFRPNPAYAKPWYLGFIPAGRVHWLRRASLVGLAQLLRIPTLETIFQGIRIGFSWLKYVVAEDGGWSMPNLVFAGAQVFGALVVANQMAVGTNVAQSDLTGRLLIDVAVWIPWGLLIALRQRGRDSLFFPVLGVAFISVPAVLQFAEVHSHDARVLAQVAIATGLGLWLVGAATRAGAESKTAPEAAAAPSTPIAVA